MPDIDRINYKGAEYFIRDIRTVITPTAAIPIPEANTSQPYNMTGLTASHEVVRWNFSLSADNSPPCDLTITTYDGYFTIANTSSTTTLETVKPVFAVPTALSATQRA